MGIIELEDIEFYAYHGCFKEEQIVGNYFNVNISLRVNCETPAASDNIQDAVNYQRIYDLAKEQMFVTSHLLEHVAQRIIDSLYSEFSGISDVTVKVSKKNPPLGGKLHRVSVTLTK